MKPPDENPPGMTAAQVAELAGISLRTFHRRRTAGAGPRGVRVGLRRVYFPREAVLDWIKVEIEGKPE